MTPHQLITDVARTKPDAKAILCRSGDMTFGELCARAAAMRELLMALSVGKGDNVGFLFRSQPEAAIAAVAVNSVGGVLVPLDPDHPVERSLRVLKTTAARALIADSLLAGCLNGCDVPIVTPAAGPASSAAPVLPHSLEAGTGATAPCVASSSMDSACILFTSGTTGEPKGVVRTQGAIMARLGWGPFSQDDLFCHYMPFCYGLSLERLFLPLMLGLPIAFLPDGCQRDPDAFIAELEHFRVSQLTVAPAILDQVLASGKAHRLDMLRSVTSGSAFLLSETISEFYRVLPRARLINVYGSTESGTLTMGKMSPAEGPSVGRPAEGMNVYVLDENMEPVPPGVTGEVAGGGPNTASGYWRDPALSAQRFIPNPYAGDGASGTIYRTGDMGRFLPDGSLELVGRGDRQVKIRGYRVEPSEVEQAIRKCPDVADVVVTGESIGSYSRLIAYVCSRSSTLSITEVRSHLKRAVPDHMFPSAYIFLDAIPRSPLGKLDHQRLPKPGSSRPPQAESYESPATEFENEVATVWADILKLDCVGRNDHFFDLGGDSMVAVRLSNALEERLGLTVGPVTLFEQPTVAELAAALSDKGGHRTQ